MHILFLTDNFPPEVNAPASRTLEHCREWVKEGHRVTVITGAPNFPEGKVFEGYENRLWQSEVISDIKIIRVWTYIAANEGFLKRTLDYLSFMISSFFASLFVRRVDLVVGTSPQFFTVCAACIVGTVKRVPWIFELRDMWPESIKTVGILERGRWLELLERLELFLYRNSTAIVSVTESFRTVLAKRGVKKDKIHVVTNGVDVSKYFPREKDAELTLNLGLSENFVVGYIGTHGLAHALDTVLDAASILKGAPDGHRFHIIFLGAGAEKSTLEERAEEEGLDNVTFLDSVQKEEVARYWSILDASIIHLKKAPLFTTVIPSKLFECMGMSIPVLLGVEGESAAIVERNDVGLLFEPENPQALVDQLRRLAGDQALATRLKGNGPVAVRQFDRSILAGRMLQILVEVARKHTP
jgi:glycosyltransferase involved in cell wall biosynthesis